MYGWARTVLRYLEDAKRRKLKAAANLLLARYCAEFRLFTFVAWSAPTHIFPWILHCCQEYPPSVWFLCWIIWVPIEENSDRISSEQQNFEKSSIIILQQFISARKSAFVRLGWTVRPADIFCTSRHREKRSFIRDSEYCIHLPPQKILWIHWILAHRDFCFILVNSEKYLVLSVRICREFYVSRECADLR